MSLSARPRARWTRPARKIRRVVNPDRADSLPAGSAPRLRISSGGGERNQATRDRPGVGRTRGLPAGVGGTASGRPVPGVDNRRATRRIIHAELSVVVPHLRSFPVARIVLSDDSLGVVTGFGTPPREEAGKKSALLLGGSEDLQARSRYLVEARVAQPRLKAGRGYDSEKPKLHRVVRKARTQIQS